MPAKRTSFVASSFSLLRQTFFEWVEDHCVASKAANNPRLLGEFDFDGVRVS